MKVVEIHLKELDTVIAQLNKYRDLKPEIIKQDLKKRWAIKMGLEAGAQIILEIADHIFSNHFGYYSETYEGTLKESISTSSMIAFTKPEDLSPICKGDNGRDERARAKSLRVRLSQL